MKLIDWQFYPSFRFQFKKSRYDYLKDSWWEYYVIIGPLQTRWWGKVWPRLERSPLWSARMKQLLLEDLETMKT